MKPEPTTETPTPQPTPLSRRQWLGHLARWSAAATILGGLGLLVSRSQCTLKTTGKTPCAACPQLARCELDAAQTTPTNIQSPRVSEPRS